VFDRVTGKPVWPIEERPVPKSDVPGEWTSPTQPFPTVVPPFARQGMKPDDMYDGFMTPEEKVHWTERLKNARTGLYTPPGLVDTILLPSVNGGAFYFSTGADSAHGIVFVQSKDVPSIIKMVPAGESTAANSGATIPARPRTARGGGGGGGFGPQAMAARTGRAVYDQSCQVCHGPDLKGDRGPEIDNAVARLGADEVSNIISKGRGGMPPFPAMSETYKKSLLTFLSNPDLAPPGSAIHPGDLAARDEPSYPAYVSPPPSRYKTGYGSEGYVIKPPWSTLTAYDLNTGKIMWQTPYGDLPQAGPSDKLRGNVSPRGSFVVTGGGLVLFASNDSKLYVLDEHTGKVIFTKNLPNSANAVPAVYEVDGREYVLFSLVGGTGFPPGTHMPPGGVNPPSGPKSYIALALPKQ
jgi:quinoprotein glucose dehydrogenase